MLKKLSFRTRIFIGFGSVLVLMLISALISINCVNRIYETTNLINEHPQTVLAAMRDIQVNTIKVNHLMRDLLDVNDSILIEKIDSDIIDLDKTTVAKLLIIKDRFLGNAEDVSVIEKIYKDWKMIREETISYIKNKKYSQGRKTIESLDDDYVHLLSSKYDFIEEYASRKADEQFIIIDTNMEETKDFLIYTSIFMLLFASVITILISNSISKPITKLLKETVDFHKLALRKDINLYSEQSLLENTIEELNVYYEQENEKSRESIKDKKIIEDQLQKIEMQSEELRILNKELENKVLLRTEEVAKSFDELRESKDILQSYLDSSPDPIIVLDENAKLNFVSRSTLQIFGLELETDLSNVEIFDFIHPEDKEIVGNSLNKLINTGEYTNPLIRMFKKDGSLISVQINSSFLKNEEGKVSILIIAHDITQRLEMESELKVTNERLKSLFDSSPNGIGIVTDRMFYEVNDKFCKISGYSREEIIGNSTKMIYPTEEDYEFIGADNYAQLKEKGTETKLKKKNGSIIDILLVATPLDTNNLKKGITFTATDITERNRIKSALKQSENRYRNIFENSIISTLVVKNGKFVDCNRATIDLLGYNTKDEFLNSHPSEISPEKQPDGQLSLNKADEMIELALKNGNHRFEWNHKKSNGEILPVEVTLTTLENEKDNKVLFTVWRVLSE
ncbi:MAG: PAS domain S-box protein [Candidatus Delongbacteria bacterium]|jgi:PAS domain S-box-containing protein|nr:PAS domain S-box protein [Candidatus Delongbacteria bacterium]